MLAEYERFVRAHFGPIGVRTPRLEPRYVVTTKMGDLYELKGDRSAVSNGPSRRWKRCPTTNGCGALHAQYLVTQAISGPEGRREAMRSRAESALQALADAKDGYHSRKAAAVLAGVHMFHRDYARALPTYQQYASTYPESPFAWGAELRAAQCMTALGKATGRRPVRAHR
jgi:hypothetical protein